jgi:pimeloyl-ACP methyl ester carboxylesterase
MDTRAPVASRANSTIGRSITSAPPSVRAYFRLLSAVAPGLAERHATRIFFTPHRRARHGPAPMPGAEGQRFTVAVGRAKVACWSYGRGPAVLMVHGWGGSAADWDALAPRVVAAGYRAIVFDAPAHGLSGGRRTTLPEMARTLDTIADEVAHGPDGRFAPLEAVVAHSFGAAAAVLAARDGLAMRDLVLLAPVAEPLSFVPGVADALGLPEARRAGMLERIRVAAGGDLSRIEVVRAITGSTLPGLVIHDRDDTRVASAQGRSIAAAWPRARFVETRGLGHGGVLRAPEVLDRIVGHLRRDVRPAASLLRQFCTATGATR